jgi:hypothetical protein
LTALKLTIASWGAVELDNRELKNLMRSAAGTVRTQARRLLARSAGGGRFYAGGGGGAYRGGYRAGRYRASAPGAAPVSVSGTLAASLAARPYKSGQGFAVRARAFYGLFLEAGARGGGNPHGRTRHHERTRPRRRRRGYGSRVLLPRPFLSRVMDEQAPDLNRRVSLALRAGIKWKATK